MHIRSAEFTIGAVRRADLPHDGLPEVAFSGRSNVGKSSLINRLLQRRNLARTSSTPGKTQQLNYYCINQQLYMVDLPGYGFVSGGVGLRDELGRMTADYVESRPPLRAIVQLVDVRHGPTELDEQMIAWLRERERPFLIVFTKVDKLSRNKLKKRLAQVEAEGALVGLPFATFSAVSGVGCDDILEWIVDNVGVKRGMATVEEPT